MGRALLSGVSILVLLVAALLVVPGFFDWNSYKPQITAMVRDKTGLEIELNGDLKLAILPAPYAYVNDVVVRSARRDGKFDTLASLQRLDLNLALASLMQGKIELSSASLVKPLVQIETYADGTQNWQSDVLTKQMEQAQPQSDGAEASQAQDKNAGKGGSAGLADSITLGNLSIRDGTFAFYDARTQSEQRFENIDLSVKADTLSGPFSAQGSIIHDGRSLKFEAKIGRLTSDMAAVPVNISARVTPEDVQLTYSGVIDRKSGFAVQGETHIAVQDVSRMLSIIGASNPMIKSAKLDVKGFLSADAEKFTMQNAKIDWGANRFNGSFGGSYAPLAFDVDIRSERLNIASALDIPALNNADAIDVSGKISSLDDALQLRGMKVKLGATELAGDLTYQAKPNQRPKLNVKLSSPNLDANVFMPASSATPAARSSGSSVFGGGSGGGAQGGNALRDSLKALQLPFDLDFDVAIAKGRYTDQAFSNLVAKGKMEHNKIALEQFKVDDIHQSSVTVRGAIGDIENLRDVDGLVNLSSRNARVLAEGFAVDTSAFPSEMTGADIALQLKGSADQMAVTANIKALNGEVIAAGNVGDVLGALTIGGLDLQIKHRNVNEALNIVSPGSGNFPDLNKPLDFFAKVNKDGEGYELSDIRANIAGISATGSAGLNLSQAKPYLIGDLALGNVVIGNRVAGGSAAPSSGSGGSGSGGASSAPSGGAGWSREALDSAWMNAMDFDLSITAQSINYQGWAFSRPVLKAQLRQGVLTLEQLQGGLYDGQVFLKGSMRPFNQERGYTIDGNVNLREVSLEPLVGSLTGNRILTGRGLINNDTSIKAGGVSPSALVNSLAGRGEVTGREIVLTGFDLNRFARALSTESRPGDTALGLWQGSIKGGSTAFDTLDGDFTINEGVATIPKMDLDGPTAHLGTKGRVDLPQFTITTEHTITLKGEDEIPPFTINISGPLNNPAQTFGQGILQDYVARQVGHRLEGLIGGRLGDKLGIPGLGGGTAAPAPAPTPAPTEPAANDNIAPPPAAEEPPQQQQQQQIDPEEAIRGLIRGFIR